MSVDAPPSAIDAHQHFWRVGRGDYHWLTPELAAVHRDFEEADLQPILARHGIARRILVQAAASEAETDYMLALARRAPFVAGVVGWVDFEAADVPERIAARAREPLIRGLRPMWHDLPDDAWVLRDALAPAFAALIDGGLRFDALVKPRHLPHLVRLVERYPDLSVVIDHGAKPEIARWRPGDRAFQAWSDQLRALASLGCWAKLSGLITEAAPDWRADDLRPYVDVLGACFGPDRLMWGSDWPVVELAGGFAAWRGATMQLIGGWSQPEQEALLGGTAARFYGLA